MEEHLKRREKYIRNLLTEEVLNNGIKKEKQEARKQIAREPKDSIIVEQNLY